VSETLRQIRRSSFCSIVSVAVGEHSDVTTKTVLPILRSVIFKVVCFCSIRLPPKQGNEALALQNNSCNVYEACACLWACLSTKTQKSYSVANALAADILKLL
jgi:hypothetical protein